MDDYITVAKLYNGAVVVDADSTSWGEPEIDQRVFQFTLIKHQMHTVERRPGGNFRNTLQRGRLVLVRPGEVDAVYGDDDLYKGEPRRVAITGVLFEPELAKDIISETSIDGLRNLDDPLAATLLEAIAKLDSSSDPLLVDHVTMALLHRIRGLRPQPEVRSKGRIERSIAYINERLDQKLTLAELAGAAAMSPFHFARTFRQATGMTPLAYVTSKRVDKAKAMIAHGKHPLGIIALMCGFSSQSAFSTTFKEVTGATPREYTLSLRGKVSLSIAGLAAWAAEFMPAADVLLAA